MEGFLLEIFNVYGIQYYPVYNTETDTYEVKVIKGEGRYSGDIYLPSRVKCACGTYKVTEIDDNAFYGCTRLTSIKMSNGIKRIGACAFFSCTALTSVTIPSSVEYIDKSAFEDCSSLRSVKMSKGLRVIGECAFKNCTQLTSVFIPDGVTIIGNSSFNGCANISSIRLPKGIREINSNSFSDTAFWNNHSKGGIYKNGYLLGYIGEVPEKLVIKKGTVMIAGSAFDESTRLYEVIFPDELEIICASAFSWCENLSDVVFPNGLKYIGEYAFMKCDNFSRVVLPDSVETIGEYAFSQCYNVTEFILPANLKRIGNGLFYYCLSLASICIPKTVEVISDDAFRGCSELKSIKFSKNLTTIGKTAFYECKALGDVHLPGKIKRIGYEAFCETAYWDNQNDGIVYNGRYILGRKHLCPMNVEIKEGTELIADDTFCGCDYIQSVTMHEGLKYIGSYSFYSTGIKSLNLPVGIVSIGDKAFANCSGLKSIIFPKGMIVIDAGIFTGTSPCSIVMNSNIPPVWNEMSGPYASDIKLYRNDAVLYVPKGLKDVYEDAGYWSDFKNIKEL